MVQDLATQRIQSSPCRTKTSQERRKGVYEGFSSRRKSRSHLHTEFFGIWQILWRIVLSSLNHLRLAVPTQMVWLRERDAESKKELLLCCCSLAWTECGGRMPWNVTVICEVIKILRTVIRRTTQRTSNSGWLDDRISSCFFERPVRTPSVW